MLPSVTSFLRASENQVCKDILAHAQHKKTADTVETEEVKMETESGATEEKKEESSLCLFEMEDSEVCEPEPIFQFFHLGRGLLFNLRILQG